MAGVCSQRDIVSVSNEELFSNQVPVALLAEEEQEEDDANVPVDKVKTQDGVGSGVSCQS